MWLAPLQNRVAPIDRHHSLELRNTAPWCQGLFDSSVIPEIFSAGRDGTGSPPVLIETSRRLHCKTVLQGAFEELTCRVASFLRRRNESNQSSICCRLIDTMTATGETPG